MAETTSSTIAGAARCRHAFPALSWADDQAAGDPDGCQVAAMLPSWEAALSRAVRTVARAPVSLAGSAVVPGAPLPALLTTDAALNGAVPMVVRAVPSAPPVVLVAEPALVAVLVDLFFGGTGIAAPVRRSDPTPAERTRLMALADRFAEALADGEPGAAARVLGADDPLRSKGEAMVAATFAVQLDPRPGLSGLTPARMLGRVMLATPAATRGAAGAVRPSGALDRQRWRRDLLLRLADVRLPIRAVLSRPTLSVGEVGALRPGDAVPLAIPRQVPLLIDTVRLGAGMLGAIEGTSAVRIDRIGVEPVIAVPRLAPPSAAV